MNRAMVVYAYSMTSLGNYSTPWIYGIYTDLDRGFEVMNEMQKSKDYGHLTWTNNIVKLA